MEYLVVEYKDGETIVIKDSDYQYEDGSTVIGFKSFDNYHKADVFRQRHIGRKGRILDAQKEIQSQYNRQYVYHVETINPNTLSESFIFAVMYGDDRLLISYQQGVQVVLGRVHYSKVREYGEIPY